MLPKRFKMLTVLTAALIAGQVSAAGGGAGDMKQPKEVVKVLRKHQRYSEEEIKNNRLRLAAVGERANRIFTLLGGETALQKGQAGTALAAYMLMLERTKSPEVAERALEMAVSLNAFEQAEMIYQKWRQIEPIPGGAQKRAGWLRNVLKEGGNQRLDGLEEVLAQSDDVQKRRIFLLLAQAAVQQDGLAEKASEAVRRASLEYGHMPEATVADVVFSLQAREKEKAIAALQRLSKLDAEILPPTFIALRLTARQYPEILDGFFQQTDTRKLSSAWQEMEIMNLVSLRRPDDAYKRLKVLLETNPDADLYIQAAILAANRKEGASVIDGYAEKAYGRGTGEQRGRAAMTAAMIYADRRDYAKVRQWLKKVSAPEYLFDKGVLAAAAAAELDGGRAALRQIGRVRKLPEQQGRYFTADNLSKIQMLALSKLPGKREALIGLNNIIAKLSAAGSVEPLAEALAQRSIIYEQFGKREKMIADLETALKLTPDNAQIMNNLGYSLLSDSKRLDEGFALLQTAYQINPDDTAVNDSIGWAYYLKGDAESALPYLRYSFENDPGPEVAAHLGEVLWALGERDRAVDVWTQAAHLAGDKKIWRETLKRHGIALPQASRKSRK
ncbi:TPA: tetratricopeptide repeat protein [Neisseria lactamica]|uniref:tetratricopeptide repeat protein n=1 Tax=Neisseria lactamica TaxID=486 RepID=UPI000E0D3F7D|nr:tetratricopeptide repeat protein [Neisseria lactamica]